MVRYREAPLLILSTKENMTEGHRTLGTGSIIRASSGRKRRPQARRDWPAGRYARFSPVAVQPGQMEIVWSF